ncbi:MAG: hypothetical protein Q9172_005932 [Xanthocarpia lactea]
MPRLGSNEEAFLSLVKSLQKGKAKEHVPVDISSQPQPSNKEYRGFSVASRVLSDIVEETPGPDDQPATMGAQEELTTNSPVLAPLGKGKVIDDAVQADQPSATYTVIGSNFAPGTTAADIQVAILSAGGEVRECRIVSQVPIVTAEMSFVERAQADHVIAAFDNKKADGHLLRVYMKAEDTNTPPEASRKEMELAQTEEDTLASAVQSEQQLSRPVLKERGRTLYASTNGAAVARAGVEVAATTSITKTAGSDRTVKKQQTPQKCPGEEPELGRMEAEYRRQEADADESYQERKKGEAEEMAWVQATGAPYPLEKTRARRLTEEAEVACLKSLAEEKLERQQEAVRSLNQGMKQPVDRESIYPEPSTTATANNNTASLPAAVDAPISSHLLPPGPITIEAAPRPTTVSKSSTPLLSSGHEFLQALNKRLLPSSPASTNTDRVPQPFLPNDILPDELPTATRTLPILSNGQIRPFSPLTQITTTGTLQTPSGEHTINLAVPPPPPPTQVTTTPQWTTSWTEPKTYFDFNSNSHSHYRADSKPPTPPQERPSFPTNHLSLSASDHSSLRPHPNHHINGSSSSPNPPANNSDKTLTLLSGSAPRGYIYMPRRYTIEDLIKIEKAYWRKVFSALLEREGRGKIVVAVTEGL